VSNILRNEKKNKVCSAHHGHIRQVYGFKLQTIEKVNYLKVGDASHFLLEPLATGNTILPLKCTRQCIIGPPVVRAKDLLHPNQIVYHLWVFQPQKPLKYGPVGITITPSSYLNFFPPVLVVLFDSVPALCDQKIYKTMNHGQFELRGEASSTKHFLSGYTPKIYKLS
jgi:hypothetical protein